MRSKPDLKPILGSLGGLESVAPGHFRSREWEADRGINGWGEEKNGHGHTSLFQALIFT